VVAGHLTSVVFDRATRAVTHLVVEPRRLGGTGRLVSVALVASTAGDVRLHCTSSEFKALEDAAETTRPVGASDALYGQATELFGGGGPSGLRGPHNLVVSRIPPPTRNSKSMAGTLYSPPMEISERSTRWSYQVITT
jgi:hypothetical protein